MNDEERSGAVAALEAAIDAAGGVAEVARRLGISHSAVSQWTVCPENRVLTIAALSGADAADLRPDLYGDDGAWALMAMEADDG